MRQKGSEKEEGGLPRINLKLSLDLTQILREGLSCRSGVNGGICHLSGDSGEVSVF